MLHFQMPVSVHVAKRETARVIKSRETAIDAWKAAYTSVVESLHPYFLRNRKIDGSGLRAVAGEVSDALERLDPIVVIENVREATRTRPKGEAYEFLCVFSCVEAQDGIHPPRLSTVSARIAINRKKAVIDCDRIGLECTRHAVERAIERDVIGTEDAQRGFERAFLDNAGLVVLWRYGLVRNAFSPQCNFNIPIGDGFMLGAMQEALPGTGYYRYRMDLDGGRTVPRPQNEFHIRMRAGVPETFFRYMAMTAIGENEMTLSQADYHAELRGFLSRNRDLVNALGEASIWIESDFRTRKGFADLRDGMDTALADLAAIMNSTRFARRPGQEDPARQQPAPEIAREILDAASAA